ncbi:MAG: redoxin family protein [Hyphomicrobiales bacterium]|nr:redoxin family protein [Hyphomicrobiales bacterium]
MSRFGSSRRDLLAAGGALGLFGVGASVAWRQLEMGERLFNPVRLTDFALPPVAGVSDFAGQQTRGFSAADLGAGASLVVLFASWCPPCRREHKMISQLSERTGVPVFGALYKDKPEAAVEYLRRNGNPFAAVGDDPRGLFARAIGARGVPSTLVVRPGPRVALRIDGPLAEADIAEKIAPALRAT